jgi:hypothetical protein
MSKHLAAFKDFYRIVNGPRDEDGFNWKFGRAHNFFSDLLEAAVVSHPAAPGGRCYSKSSLEAVDAGYGWIFRTECPLMNVIDELKKNFDQVQSLWKGYETELKVFRSAAKNDVSSLEAAARKTSDAAVRINSSYASVMALLNSEEMAQAVSNAERLAAAMTALASLQSHKLVFSVTEQERL